jgi:hypothetical protein
MISNAKDLPEDSSAHDFIFSQELEPEEKQLSFPFMKDLK